MQSKDDFDIECVSDVLQKYEGEHPIQTVNEFESVKTILQYLPAEYAKSLGINLSLSF